MRRNPPEACADHYTFWQFEREQVQENVSLQDQFYEGPHPTYLDYVEYLGNPAKKIRRGREEEDVHHPSVHLLAYHVADGRPAPPDKIIIRNQFTGEDGHRWMLDRAMFLLIPARKAKLEEPTPETLPPRRVDHFVCYEAKGPDIREPLVLRDQFATTDTNLLQPKFLGVPASKNEEGWVHPDVHLAIYELLPGLQIEPVGVKTYDQRRRFDKLYPYQSVWLGVPSYKERIKA